MRISDWSSDVCSSDRVLSSVVASRWKGQVQEDERDREIARHASGWWRGALIVFLVGLAVMLGFSPAERLHWASHMMIANLLVLALMWGCLVEYAATAVVYWRDRHLARGAWKWATEADRKSVVEGKVCQ